MAIGGSTGRGLWSNRRNDLYSTNASSSSPSTNTGNRIGSGAIPVPTGRPGSTVGGTISNPTGQVRTTNVQNQDQNQTTEQNTDVARALVGNKTGLEDIVNVSNNQAVSDLVLNLINQQAVGLNENTTLNATDQAREQNIQAILDQIQGFNPQGIMNMAGAQVQGLNRQLMEDVLPQITGAVEASGTSNNALGGLLASDAAARTAEAGGRVMEEARANAMNEFINMVNAATAASSGGSARAGAANELVNASRGTVDQGVEAQTTTADEQSAIGENTTTDQTGSTNTNTNTNNMIATDTYDASVENANNQLANQQRLAELAFLQSTLSPFQNLSDMTNAFVPGRSGTFNENINNSGAAIRALMAML